jgi:hypothetical protein
MPKKLVGEVDDLRVSLPVTLINYLNFLAKDSVYGASANDIASHLLIEEVRRLIREDEHELKFPMLDLRPSAAASTLSTGEKPDK